jgi:hypothetical protein
VAQPRSPVPVGFPFFSAAEASLLGIRPPAASDSTAAMARPQTIVRVIFIFSPSVGAVTGAGGSLDLACKRGGIPFNTAGATRTTGQNDL